MDFLPKSEQQQVRALSSKQERLAQGRFLVEGKKLCLEALASDFTIDYAVIKDGADEEALAIAEAFQKAGIEVYAAGINAFDRMTDAQNPQDIFCILFLPETVKDSQFSSFLALDSINDPGNLGTILRTADWFGINTIILGGKCADPYNPKTLRASMGSAFRMNVHTHPDLSSFLKDYTSKYPDAALYGFSLDAKQLLQDITILPKHWGLILGSESHGISNETKSAINTPILIPGNGKAESLNVSIATGIALYHITMLARN